MKIWTLQKKEILCHIEQTGFYQPDFSMSSYLRQFPALGALYNRVLRSFNRHNHSDLPGLVFAFTGSDNQYIYDLPTIDDFFSHMTPRMGAIRSLWKHLTEQQECVLLELEYPDTFNPIYIDINDFQFLMPPLVTAPPYTPEDVHRLNELIDIGRIAPSIFSSGIIQVHLPWIARENIVACYEAPLLN